MRRVVVVVVVVVVVDAVVVMIAVDWRCKIEIGGCRGRMPPRTLFVVNALTNVRMVQN